MDKITLMGVTITSPNITSHSQHLYESLGLTVTLNQTEIKISSNQKSIIKSVDKGIHVHIYDHSILLNLASTGLLTNSIHFVDEAGINVTAEFIGPCNFKIGVLTSGGDAPGMNAAIRAIVRNGLINGCKVYGIKSGFDGLATDCIDELKWDDVSDSFSLGGTFLLSARSKKFLEKKGRTEAVYNLVKRGISGLVVLGGDGSMRGALKLSEEFKEHVLELQKCKRLDDISKIQNLKVVVIPASIDNDIYGTELTLGAESALRRVAECVDSLWTTMASHKRAFIVEVMGRNCGWIALMSALAYGADYVFLPEKPHEDWENELKNSIKRARKEGKLGTFVFVAEGIDIPLVRIREKVEELGIETRIISLGHIQRGGRPGAFDRIMGTLLGCKAIEYLNGNDDKPVMAVLSEGEYKVLCLKYSVDENSKIIEMLSKKMYEKVMEKRGKLFSRAYDLMEQLRIGCIDISNVNGYKIAAKERINKNSKKTNLGRLAVLHEGTRAGGVNIALQTIVNYAKILNHKVLVINGGFEGLLEGQVTEADPFIYAEGPYYGVSDIGLSKEKDIEPGKVHNKFKEYNISGLIVTGGRDALKIIKKLNDYYDKLTRDESNSSDEEDQFPSIILIPASSDNDLPFTDISLGADTALNIIVTGCDFLRLSGISRKKTVFVIEIPGDRSGYLTLMSGIASAAFECFIPETPQTIHSLALTIQRLKQRLKDKNKHGLVLMKNQKTYDEISLDAFSKIIKSDSQGIFDIKYSVFGYLTEGGMSSPYDRICATSLATKAVDTCLKKKLVGALGFNGETIVLHSIDHAVKEVEMWESGELIPNWVRLSEIIRCLE